MIIAMRDFDGGFNRLLWVAIVILILIVAAASSFGTYAWQHTIVNNLDAKASNLNSQISGLNNQVSTLAGKLSKACLPAQQSNASCTRYVYTSLKGVPILIYTPLANSTVASPIAVVGEVPGNWSFEAQFPVQLKDSKGNVVVQAPAQVLGNWETTQLVPFSAQLVYTATESGTGTLVLQKDNPSGLSQNSDSVSIPINF